MIKAGAKRLLRHLGYEIHRIDAPVPSTSGLKNHHSQSDPTLIAPIWPLPRLSRFSDEEIRATFSRYDLWHYAYEFEGGLSFPARHRNAGLLEEDPMRALQRFSHLMPDLIESQEGTLKGKRVLDMACNSGFWSFQCALLGAEVLGFDVRPELIEQANLIKSVTGIKNAEFRVLDFWEMSPQTLGGKFDVVLNLGILYHLPKPLEVLERTQSIARKTILLDTVVLPSESALIKLTWEEPLDIRCANTTGVVAIPSKSSIELLLRHLRFKHWFEIPIRTRDMPNDYLNSNRASWLIEI